MTEKQYEELCKKIDKELEEYRKEIVALPPEQIYDRYYEISGFEELHEYLVNYGQDMNIKGFPKKDILTSFYNDFMRTEYDLTQEDLGYFFEFQIEDNIKRKRFDNQM